VRKKAVHADALVVPGKGEVTAQAVCVAAENHAFALERRQLRLELPLRRGKRNPSRFAAISCGSHFSAMKWGKK
jgi:hypothetical protein